MLRSRRWITLSTDAITQYDAESVGPKVKAPTLLIYGEGDALRRGEEQAQQGIKGSIYKMVPGVRDPHWEEPEEFVTGNCNAEVENARPQARRFSGETGEPVSLRFRCSSGSRHGTVYSTLVSSP